MSEASGAGSDPRQADQRDDDQRSGDRPSGEPGAGDAERVVIRDKRRIDPKTGQVRPASDSGAGPRPDPVADDSLEAELAGGEDDPVLAELRSEIAERTGDLQRLQAEYANYRKRMDRDRALIAEAATGSVVAGFLPVLDDLDRAREHGDMVGGLKSVADQIDSVLANLGLVAFGEVGDPFDPTIHEAVLHDTSEEVDVPTCTTVMRKGYRIGERLLRPAMVGVSDPG